jgi:hypothetical protein
MNKIHIHRIIKTYLYVMTDESQSKHEHWQLHIENESKTRVLRLVKNWLFLIKDIQQNDSQTYEYEFYSLCIGAQLSE